MLASIKEFFERHVGLMTDGAGAVSERGVQLATAALLLEMMRIDYQTSEAERRTVLAGLEESFALSETEATDLLSLAEAAGPATDYFQYTSRINKSFTLEQKIRLIEHLWEVAYADHRLDKYEDHLAHKIADLLYVPLQALIAAKQRVRGAAGETPEAS